MTEQRKQELIAAEQAGGMDAVLEIATSLEEIAFILFS